MDNNSLDETRVDVIKIGQYEITIHPHGGYWISNESGEGMQVKKSFEDLITQFYADNF